MPGQQVAEIFVPDDRSVGSGYFLSSRLVLTAKHVVGGVLPGSAPAIPMGPAVAGEPARRCRVRALGNEPGLPFFDAWVVWWPAEADVALLAVAPEGAVGKGGPIVWADLEEDPVDVTATGFPERDQADGVRESRQLSGQVNPLSGRKGGRWVVGVDPGGGRRVPPHTSVWAGMSGAALFAGDLLVGIICTDPDVADPGGLELWALPAGRFAEDPGLLAWLRWDRGELRKSDGPPETPLSMLRTIVAANAEIPVLSDRVASKVVAAIEAQRHPPSDLATRRAVGSVLAQLRGKRVMYAGLDDEIWEYVFASLRELRTTFGDALAELIATGPPNATALLDVMVTAVREYLTRYETRFIRFMLTNLGRTSSFHWEREWPEREEAAVDLAALREVLTASIRPLNALARGDEAIDWEASSYTTQWHWSHARLERTGAEALSARDSYSYGEPLSGARASSVPALVAGLNSELASVRMAAFTQLEKINDPEVTDALIDALGSRDRTIASQAERALRSRGLDPGEVSRLVDIARRHADWNWG